MGKSVQALVALGANLPFEGETPAGTILQAVKMLAEEGLSVLALSPLYATPCFPAGAGPDYVNAAAVLQVRPEVDAASILQRLHQVEGYFGRIREQRWGMRTLDIDLVGFGDSVLPDAATQDAWRNLPPEAQARTTPDRLILPHPRMQDRGFVLGPLAEIAPGWRHPLTGHNVTRMLADLGPGGLAGMQPMNGMGKRALS